MKANELTFGIEVECLIPVGQAGFTPGKYHRGLQVQKAPTGWNSQKDGSLMAEDGYKTCEVVSPILAGEDGIAQVFYMAEYLQEVGAKFNRSMGLHVHVGAAHLTGNQRLKLAKLFREHEQAFLALNGYEAELRLNNRFCDLSPRWSDLVDYRDRYRSLNMVNLNDSKGTVEFRLFYGTNDPAVLLTAVYMCVALVAKVSQMSDVEAQSLTKYPRPIGMKEAAYGFIRSVWNRRSNLIIPDARAKDVYEVLLAKAGEVWEGTETSYKSMVAQRWARQ